MTMTFDHPRFEEFLRRLEGPEGINLRDDGRHDCEGDTDKRKSEAILRDMGLSSAAIASSFAYFEARGGFCDFEIVMDMEPTDADRQITNQEAGHADQ